MCHLCTWINGPGLKEWLRADHLAILQNGDMMNLGPFNLSYSLNTHATLELTFLLPQVGICSSKCI